VKNQTVFALNFFDFLHISPYFA